MKKKTTSPRPRRKPAVSQFLKLARDGVKPRLLPLPTGKHRGRLIGSLDDEELGWIVEGYRGCQWHDVAAVLEIEQHRRQLKGSR